MRPSFAVFILTIVAAPAAAQAPTGTYTFDLESAIADGPSLTPEQAVQLATASAPELERARARIEGAEAAAARARAAMLPRLDLSFNYQHVDGFPDAQISLGADPNALAAARMLAQNVTDPAARMLWLGQIDSQATGGATIQIPRDRLGFGARITWPVSDMFFAILPALQAAEAGERARELERDAAEAQLARSVLEAYYQLAHARGAYAVAQEGLRDAEEQRGAIEAAVRAGFMTRADSLALDARIAELRTAVANTEAAVTVSDVALRSLLAADPGPVYGVALGEPRRSDLSVDEALTARPELAAVREAIRAQGSARDAQLASGYPHVGVYAGADYANPNRYQVPPQQVFQGSWEVGVSLTWSPNDTLSAVHRNDELGADIQALEAQLEGMERMVRVELAQARAQREANLHALEAARALVETAQLAYEERQAEVAAGETTATELLEIEARLVQARLSELDAEVQLRLAGVREAYATGAL
ncbi:MAG: TolC family protein [Sandaracinaceae bacterium]